MEEDIDIEVAANFIGEARVGKTCIITRYAKGVFEKETISTTKFNYFTKDDIKIKDKKVRLSLYDFGGEVTSRDLENINSNNLQGYFIVYDITNKQSFEQIEKWFNMVPKGENIYICLIGNKSDLKKKASKCRRREEIC